MTGDSSQNAQHISKSIQNIFPYAKVTTPAEIATPQKKSIYIAVGPVALKALLSKNIDVPIFTVFTSSLAYKDILSSRPMAQNVTAIYAEPSPSNQLWLASMLYRKKITVAVLVSHKTSYLIPLLKQIARQRDIDLHIERVSEHDNLNKALNLITHAQVLLAIPDNTIYQPENIRHILMTTYRHNQPVIGFTKSLVNAGALTTTYSDITDVVEQLREMITQHEEKQRLPEPQFPKYFKVSINDAVAKSLNLLIDEQVRQFSRKPDERSQ